MPGLEPLVVNHLAVSRRDRRPAGDAAAAVVVDDRSLASLLDFAVEFGRYVRFPNGVGEDHSDPDWSALLASDAAMALGSMIATDVDDLESRFDDLQRRARATPQFEAKLALVRQAAGMVLDMVRKLDLWRLGLEQAHPGEVRNLMLGEVRSAIGELRKPIAALRGYDLAAARPDALGEALGCRYPEQWGDCIAADEIAFEGATRGERLDWLVPRLDPMMAALARATDRLRDAALVSFEASLATGDHAPHVALFVAFARLFAHPQATLNALPRRYLDFYYREVLDGRPRGPTLDRLYLSFTADPAGSSVAVPAGTLFPAGQDESGQPIVYGLDREVTVGIAELAEVRTLLARRDTRGAQQVFASSLMPGAQAAPWATFGAGTEGNQPEPIGFAVRSDLLRLSGGQRQVTVEIRCSDVAQGPESLLRTEDASKCLLARCFRLRIATADGWTRIPSYEAELLPGSPSPGFRLVFELGPAAPAVGAGDGEPPILEVLVLSRRVAAGHDVRVWPLAALGGLTVTEVFVRVEVDGLEPVGVRNTDGAVDPGGTFSVFGAAPQPGSFLAAHHPELTGRNLTEVSVDVAWQGRPPGGLPAWYDGYDLHPPPDDEVFRGIVTVGAPADDSPSVPLFGAGPLRGSAPNREVTDPTVWLVLKAPDYGFGAARYSDAVSAAAASYAKATIEREREHAAACGIVAGVAAAARSGTWDTTHWLRELLGAIDPLLGGCPPDRMTRARERLQQALNGRAGALPDRTSAVLDAIGDSSACSSLLAQHVAATQHVLQIGGGTVPEVIQVALERLAKECRDGVLAASAVPAEAPILNPPYVPMAQRITIGYAASGDAELLHLLPFGEVATANGRLVPHFDHAGTLLLRFARLGQQQVLPLLFHLAPSAGEAARGSVAWWRKTERGWEPIDRVADATGGLTRTGIVALDLGGHDPVGGWLRATVQDQPERRPATVAIHPFAAPATRQPGGDRGPGLDSPLPAGTVMAPLQPIAGLAAVRQPLPSVGGKPAEDDAAFELRLSERLRHKDRASLPWDYERIVLERFPRVWKVATLPASDRPGTVTVVVVPQPDALTGPDRRTPMLPGEELAAIRSLLASLAGPFVQLEVANPIYRTVRVRARVDFVSGSDPGEAAHRLNDQLVAYLSPGYHDEAREAIGGGYVTKEGVAGFVQARPDVWRVRLLCLEHGPVAGGGNWCYDTAAEHHDIRYPGWRASS